MPKPARAWLVVLVCWAALGSSAGCVQVQSVPERPPPAVAYAGQLAAGDRFAIVTPGRAPRVPIRYITILSINDASHIWEWYRGIGTAYMAPGEYRFRVEFNQRTETAGIFGLFEDIETDAKFREATIAFRVQPGTAYGIHFKQNEKTYFISASPSAPAETELDPPFGAVECVKSPDRSAELWCELIPEIE